MSDFVETNRSLRTLRKEDVEVGLNEADLADDPFTQFNRWLSEALARDVPEPNAMTLATATGDGVPSARVVLLRGFDERGFVFFTNYESQKGRELAENPRAALVFHWPALGRQVRITGEVSRVSREESEAYFHTRPRGSQLSAWASEQSAVIPDRATLEERLREIEQRFPEEVPLPPFWGGYRVSPTAIEFWQSRRSRLHDRLRYTRQPDGTWRIERLSP
ncbi:pyridoxamine 5'-phosphate oxidase [Sphaerobacter thermophilus]|uniref:Pyridoxamine 5'-phosphate oxidase n=1 Tax=Sphaerobacter thermophilus (strain ATCC 49802 / DSM 20745 / KCCM 41009 / NCIMB 13125 / S 6022) TaxID=479434 RepID=D1C7W4_SPHTD|nr:pyridoxamine 5'-phosphate oxidase [Sphaerobacter thermophilus]ACZ39835.1 pyridoxamine 5'-phosphate oxidase [Sphaerobacter thermophilus DSM 20745]